MATQTYGTSRIARLAGFAIAVAAAAFTTAAVASITSSENPSTDGSYTVSWAPILTAENYQLYESGKRVYDAAGTYWRAFGKAAGTYTYRLEYCGPIFDVEVCEQQPPYAPLTVTVSSAPPPTVTPSFNKSAITLGDSVDLTWMSTNATSCSGEPSIGSAATKGTKTYTPSSTGSFSVAVTCTGAGGSAEESASVKVNPRKPTVRVSFNKRVITFGDSVDLTWMSTDATSCSGEPPIGSPATKGTKTYTPSSAGSFSVTVTCTGAGGSAEATASVKVPPRKPTVSPSFNESVITLGESVDLTWKSTDATSCSGEPPIGSTDPSGTETYTPSSTGIFEVTVTCVGLGGSAEESASVKVDPRPPTVRVSFNESVITLGESVDLTWSSDDATSCSGEPPIGSTATKGTKTYTPSSTGIFEVTVTCVGPGGSGHDSDSVTVPPPPGTTTVNASFDQSSITLGSSVKLTWYSKHATACSGSPSIGSDKTSGTKTYTPSSTGSFEVTVTCTGDDGSAEDSASVTVNLPAPTLTVPATDSDGSYLVKWTRVSGATGYRLEERSGSGSFGNIYTGGSISKNIADKPDGTYGYRVRACDEADNCGDWSQTRSVAVAREHPPVPTNNAPVAFDDAAQTPFGTPVEIAVLANDTDADDDSLVVTVVTAPANGTATITSDDDGNDTRVTYTPASGYTGDDTFDYTVSDGTASDIGTVSVTVTTVTVTPNPSTTGSYTLSWQETLLADRYRVLESVAGGASLVSYHLRTSVEYTGKATGEYHYLVERCQTPLGQDEDCVEYGRVTAQVVLPITPGNLPYRSGVTKGGDAYVNVPIAPVPGVNGLAPRLSIDYSGGRERHQSDQELPADTIGYGWRVGGFSTIRRCVKGTIDSDGISFDDSDALCLDGEPLTQISDTQQISDTHLKAGAEYRTARESFAKVVMKASASGDWFEVHLPDGTVREYGATDDSQLGNLAHPGAAFLWSINKQTDAFGNVMTYAYEEDSTALARRPQEIAYGDEGDATIEFVYKPRDDLEAKQVAGFSLGQPQRLTQIQLRLDGALVRDYRLAYQTTRAGRVRLNALQTCGYGPSGTRLCLLPLSIGWLNDAGGTQVSQLTDPMGVETTFAIAMLSASGPHDFVLGADDTPFGATSLPANTRALLAQNGEDKPVVTSVTRSDGIGGKRVTRYAYLGRGVENTRNWGFLGFHAIRERDEASGIVTYTQYRLDYPHFGSPAQVVRYHGNYTVATSAKPAKTPLSKRAVRYAEKSVSHAGSAVTTTLPHAEETMEWLYEGTSTLGAAQTTEALTLASGFVTESVRETRTGHSAPGDANAGSAWGAGPSHTLSEIQRTTKQTLSFDNDATAWVLGFAADIDVKHYSGDGAAAGATPDWTETVERTAIEDTLAPDIVTRFPGDKLQHKTDYRYNTRGNRDQASETEGLPASDSDGESSGTPDDETRTWEVLEFAADRFPTSWQNPLAHKERATHHVGLGVPATTTDANNRRTSYAYDGLGRETARTRHWDSVTTTDEDGEKTTADVATTTAYALCHASSCDAVAATAAACGRRYSVAPVMKVTTSAPDMPDSTAYLDMFGRAIRTSVEGFGGADRRADVFYDARGRMVCESEPYHAGETAAYTRHAYDNRDRLRATVRPDGGVTRIAYAASSNTVTATVTEIVESPNGRNTITEATRKTQRTRNVLGELESITEGAGEVSSKQVTTRYAYDGAGRLQSVATGGQTTTFAYDAAGNRASVTNPNLGATAAAGDGMASVTFAYNGHGELTERADARGATYYGYDKLGRRTCAADRGGTAVWEYDPANGAGLLKRRGYDRDKVLTSAASCPFGGDFAETYAYNADARLETVTTTIVDDENATATLTRGHAYDDYGRPSSTTYPSGVTVTQEYERGYRTKLKHGDATLAHVTARTARGRPEAESYGNGARTRRRYDGLGRPTRIETTRGGATIQNNAYVWRSDGSLHRRAAGAGRGARLELFAYDHLNRLTGAKTRIAAAASSRTLTFGYDPRGNLETKKDSASPNDSVTNTYPKTSNQLMGTTIGGVKYGVEHDPRGHIEAYACADPDETDEVDPCLDVADTFIEWNARGLAAKVTAGESGTDETPKARDSFRYGPDGARHFKKSEWTVGSGAAATMYTSRKYYAGAYEKTVTAGGDTVERVRIGESVVHVKTTPAGMPAGQKSVFEYAHRDHLGSLESVTDAAGKELVVLAHDPYGERRKPDWTGRMTAEEIEALLRAQGERVSRGFTGHEHLDRTGLIHMNGRMYDPRLGRFLSPDPIVGDPTSSQSWNLYSYVGNNPLSYVDPTGLVQAGPMCPVGGAMLCMDGGGGGGGSTARTVTVTETVYGVVAIPYGYSVPSWTRVWDRGLDHYVWDLSYDHYWAFEYRTFSYDVTRTIMLEDQSVADQPADLGGLGIAAADIGASILIPGYDLVRCHMEGNCEWTDWVLGVGEIAITATGVGYGVRVAAKAAKVADSAGAATQPNRIYSARELVRRANEPGPYHNFPESFNREIFEKGTRTATRNAYPKARHGLSNDMVKYLLPGRVNGRDGVFEIFTRPSTSGNTEVIMHRFFRPDS